MVLDLNQAERIARHYTRGREKLQTLGWGVSGFVFLSPDLQTAVKVHKHPEQFDTELAAYQRLRYLGITELNGLTIPMLRGFDESRRIIAMDVVRPPYLLDFAGVRFEAPDFSEDVMASWHENIVELFGGNAQFVHEVYHALAAYELYYLDFRPSNLNLTGLRDLPDEP